MGGIKSYGANNKPFIEDFPNSAITALSYLYEELNRKYYIVNYEDILRELNRIGRFTPSDLSDLKNQDIFNAIRGRLLKFKWQDILYFCERTYDKLLSEVDDINYGVPLVEVKRFFSDEINVILDEERINFFFVEGEIKRRDRLQTRKSLEKVGYILADDRFIKVRNLYNKAQKAFNERPNPDAENCVKDALCALEACVEILTGHDASQNFTKAVNQIKGNGNRQIPGPIAESLIKFYSYRGSAEGVGHAALDGNRVNVIDAEFVLSLVATYITYLVDVFPFTDEVPF